MDLANGGHISGFAYSMNSYIYDVNTKAFTATASRSVKHETPRKPAMGTFTSGSGETEVAFIGEEAIEVYNTVTKTWSVFTTEFEPKTGHGIVQSEDLSSFLLFGGATYDGEDLQRFNVIQRFDKDGLTEVGSLGTAKSNFAIYDWRSTPGHC